MAQRRLAERHRLALRELMRKIVTCPLEDEAILASYKTAAPLVRATVEAEYPPRDMKICKRYDAAKQDDCIKLRLTSGGDVMFNFNDNTGPLVVKMTYNGKMFLADAATTDAVLNWQIAVKVRTDAFDRKRRDYLALINSASTLEEVEAVWDEAKAIRGMFDRNQTALSVLTPEVTARIKADVEARKAGK